VIALLELIALVYAVLLALASVFAASLCRIAHVSAQQDINDQREVVLWGSAPAWRFSSLQRSATWL
jgi:hypothetical protein